MSKSKFINGNINKLNNNENEIYDYIIIGAGISGLYCNYLLKKKNNNFKILIIESSNRIGGRIYNSGNSNLGAKFLHTNIGKITNKKNNKEYYQGKLNKNNKNKNTSMLYEELGSLSKNIHPLFSYDNEVNVEYNFEKLINKYKKNAKIKFNYPYKNYEIDKKGIINLNNKYFAKKIIFGLPVNIMKKIDNPYKKLFNNWMQTKVNTLSFELNNYDHNCKEGFFYLSDIKKTSFFYNKIKNILYVNIFDRPKNISLRNIIKNICKKLNINSFNLRNKNWLKDENLLGGWSIPRKTLTKEKIKKIENGYKNKIFYIGDYLGKIYNIGTVTNALNSVNKLIKNKNL